MPVEFSHVFQHRDRVARHLEDVRQDRHARIEVAVDAYNVHEVALSPRFFRHAQVGEDDVGDEAVGVGQTLLKVAVAPNFERGGRPHLGDRGLRGLGALVLRALVGLRHHEQLAVVIGATHAHQRGGVYCRDAGRVRGGIPRYSERTIAQYRAVDCGIQVEQGERVALVGSLQ